MSKANKPQWKYQYITPTSGRKLYLLAPDELITAAPIIKNTLRLKYDSKYIPLKLFRTISQKEMENRTIELQRTLREFNKQYKNGLYQEFVNNDIELELHIVTVVNMYCNQIFSDDGWKHIRKQITQANKRKKTTTVVLDESTYIMLSQYMADQKIKVHTEAVHQLLVDAKLIEDKFEVL
ncbi:hypothetical protein GCM10011607_12540 [Shewanella inventionis]|uniref:Integrase n=1 Tax=Shewanella inventionis TaxID=1738770 RepID=A0ABQ1IXH5_9GAMM|nr:hypothetical protein [Shewanella inventionis]GGB53472.1 hypothetical protein GCM10011607_12540 [Shewanella inventionis]